jgi:hypothetical protein
LFKYNLTIILFVGSIVVVGSVISTSVVSGVELLIQPTFATLEVIIGPIGVPEESASCISTYASISSPTACFK